eukprot:Gb_09964 [translate_table: standard]
MNVGIRNLGGTLPNILMRVPCMMNPKFLVEKMERMLSSNAWQSAM